MKLSITRESTVSNSIRARQVQAAFDVPANEKQSLKWTGDVPIEAKPWQIGLIVGPSGCGKSTVAREMFGTALDTPLSWSAASVIDDFAQAKGIEEITAICQAVGFNTIPAWLRPYGVLSNGEKFRVDLARRLLEGGPLVAVDEFTSVVDRQVAKIGAHAVQKWVRKNPGRQFVAVTCHYDIIDWLQPDWILEPATMTFASRSLQRRPVVECEIGPVPYSAWRTFAPFHYLTAELSQAARCFVLSADGRPAAFCAPMYRPHFRSFNRYGFSRVVTLPDWQGLGLAMALVERVASCFRAFGYECNNYPAHPSYIRSHERSANWKRMKEAGKLMSMVAPTEYMNKSRPCGVYQYIGKPSSFADALRLLHNPLHRIEPFNAKRRV